MQKTVLITGVLGFIPSSLAKHLLSLGYTVVGIDNFLTGRIENIAAVKNDTRFHFVKGNANELDELYPLFFQFNPDYVFHYAACVGVKRTLENPLWVLEDIKGFEAVLNLSKDFRVNRVFFSSSSEVYGEPVELPQVENTTPLNSKLPYAVVKNLGEVYCKTWQQEYNLDYTIFRFFNTYGPGQSPDFVISKFMRQAMKNEPITIYGDGSQSRTFCFIDDNIQATTAAMDHPMAVNAIVNIGSPHEISILQLAQTIVKVADSKSKLVHLPALEEGDMTRRQPDNSKMLALLNGRKLISLEEGLVRTYEYLKTIHS